MYCDVHYDVFGKLEDFNEDVLYISMKQNITEHLQVMSHVENGNPKRRRQSQRRQIEKYMSQLNADMVQELYKLYQIDFEMFEYNWFYPKQASFLSMKQNITDYCSSVPTSIKKLALDQNKIFLIPPDGEYSCHKNYRTF